jgi:GNAT superfamily N-acetyltransferase
MSNNTFNQDFFCTSFDFATPEYDESIKLRYDVLRKPLGLEFLPEDLATEFDSFHIGCYEKQTSTLVGCLILKSINPDKVKMRQVAVDAQYQSKGVGSFLVAYSESYSIIKGFKKNRAPCQGYSHQFL